MKPDRLKSAEDACELTVIGEVTCDGVFLEDDGIKEIERKGYRSL